MLSTMLERSNPFTINNTRSSMKASYSSCDVVLPKNVKMEPRVTTFQEFYFLEGFVSTKR
jgi:hypothetical protein